MSCRVEVFRCDIDRWIRSRGEREDSFVDARGRVRAGRAARPAAPQHGLEQTASVTEELQLAGVEIRQFANVDTGADGTSVSAPSGVKVDTGTGGTQVISTGADVQR